MRAGHCRSREAAHLADGADQGDCGAIFAASDLKRIRSLNPDPSRFGAALHGEPSRDLGCPDTNHDAGALSPVWTATRDPPFSTQEFLFLRPMGTASCADRSISARCSP